LHSDHKLILDPEKGTHRMFDVFADPYEERDLATQKGALGYELLQAIKAFEEGKKVEETDR